MRLLICTQAVDLDDPVLGFFHRWIEELSKRYDTVHVICLKRGRMNLPSNVSVHSLGKESYRGLPSVVRVRYVVAFYRYVWRLRREYDSVFVHMNQEYVLLGGSLWKLWGKRVVLWRNHKMGSTSTRLACRLAQVVCYTSPEAFVAKFKNAVKMPIGIDTNFFSPGTEPKPKSILFLGRLDVVKKVDTFVRALEELQESGATFSADIVGDPTDPKSDYAHDVRNLASPLCLEGVVAMHPAVTNDLARDFFRAHAIYCNLTPSGSFDKTIGEAMASGCVVVCANAVVKDVVGELFVPELSQEGAARALRKALALPSAELQAIRQRARAYIEREHSLSLLTEKLVHILR